MKLKRALAALLFMSFLSSPGLAASGAPEQQAAHRKFVIYYGWYADSDGRLGGDIDRIIKSAPQYVVSPYYTSAGTVNLTPDVMSRFSAAGIDVLAYVATGNAGRPADSVLAEIKSAMNAGAAGVMLDEVANLNEGWQVDYYQKVYDYVKSFGSGRVVVANPGSILVSEAVMSVSDIVCFEHQWRLAPAIDWFSKYPPERFMGISSNDISGVMGYEVDTDTSVRDTIEAWRIGIGYHYSTDSYTRLPSWFESYQDGIRDYAAAGAKLGDLTVRTVDADGNDITGLWIQVTSNGRAIAAGFSPAKFTLPEGMHQVLASDYQNFRFSKWGDGATPAERSVAVAADAPSELVAVYRNEQADLHVESTDLLGHTVRGMPLTISQGGSYVAQGKTPLYLKLPAGTYQITASSSRYFSFVQWADAPRDNQTTVTLSGSTRLIAYYSAEGGGAGSSACYDIGSKVADSILSGGILAGLLQLEMQKSLSMGQC